MISIEDLKRMARLKGLSLGYAEKDYVIDIALLSISRNTKDELIFKGGTCLHKIYRMDRFSEDIDFTMAKKIDIDIVIKKIISDLSAFGIEANIRNEKKISDSMTLAIRTKGPLYKGVPQSFSNIKMDVNAKSTIEMEPNVARYASMYPDIPGFSLLAMQEKEILAEKIRAVMTRTKARDVYDLWFLFSKGVKFGLELVKKKLEYYNERWSRSRFEKGLKISKAVWESELRPLVPDAPDFSEVKKLIIGGIKAGS